MKGPLQSGAPRVGPTRDAWHSGDSNDQRLALSPASRDRGPGQGGGGLPTLSPPAVAWLDATGPENTVGVGEGSQGPE